MVGRALGGLRILAGLLWLYNVVWKVPPEFGRDRGGGLYGYVQDAIDHPVFPPFSAIMEHLVKPAFVPFGWGVLVVETALAALLLTGTFTRLAALLGIAQAGAISLSVLLTPGEWPWAYYMLLAIHVVLFIGNAGLVWGVDGVRAAAADGRGKHAAKRLLEAWGVVLSAVGLLGVVVALFSSPARIGFRDFEVSLGSYNVAGGLVLLATGVLLLLAGGTAQRGLALAAAAVAVLAAASIWLQVGRSSVWLGADLTTAALLLTGAVVAVAGARYVASRQAVQVAHG